MHTAKVIKTYFENQNFICEVSGSKDRKLLGILTKEVY